jgi:hypothetical protein
MITSLAAADRVLIRRATPRFTLVETRTHGYYRTLRDKLHWGGGIHGTGLRAPRAGEAPGGVAATGGGAL